MANTTYEELWRKVLLRLNKSDGRAQMAAKDGVNDAQRVIARVRDFDELIAYDRTSAATVASTSIYHIEDDLSLTRPKDIYSIKLMDSENSRKLIFVPSRRVDKIIPYPATLGEGRSKWYTRRGMNIELFRTPDDAYSLYIQHSQWPLKLSADGDNTSYSDVDDVIITLGHEMAEASLEGAVVDWDSRAEKLLAGAIREEITRPDREFIARPFDPKQQVYGEYWKQPFTLRDPS